MNTHLLRIQPPPLACDCHAHIFGPLSRYPLAENRDWTPPDRPVEAYAEMLDTLHMQRGVIVHSSSHGIDNRVTLDAIARMGPRCRGIALIAPTITDRELEALVRGGMVGIRLSTMLKGDLGIDYLVPMAQRLRDIGWHIDLHFDRADEIIDLRPSLETLAVPCVIDHMGRVRGSMGVGCAAFQTLLRLVRENDHIWVKICSWYRLSDQGAPYDDMRPYVDALIEARPDRLLWGSNWPHPLLAGPPPDDIDLLEQFQHWAGPARDMILADNPATLFGFTTP
jgi:2-pyrone-4,6-dicarboxylate lactonase